MNGTEPFLIVGECLASGATSQAARAYSALPEVEELIADARHAIRRAADHTEGHPTVQDLIQETDAAIAAHLHGLHLRSLTATLHELCDSYEFHDSTRAVRQNDGCLATDRRTSPRVELVGPLPGQLMPLAAAVTVINIGAGGFAIRTDASLVVGSLRQFRFTLHQAEPLTISSRVIYSLRAYDLEGRPFYYTGLQFIDRGPDAALVERLLSVVMRYFQTQG